VLEGLRRPAIQPVSQFLDGLHVARFAVPAPARSDGAADNQHFNDFVDFPR
jgi:hypothetical protein